MKNFKPVLTYSNRNEKNINTERNLKNMVNEISIVIGSWGSYNECNERAYGSKWLNLSEYSEWEDIVKELETEGFELDGMDEELFIQDIDNFPSNAANWDYMHPEELFSTLKAADVLDDTYKYDVMTAYLDVMSYEDFKRLVDNYGHRWCDDINIYKGFDWEDYGREMFDLMGYEIPESILDYFDFEAYGESFRYDNVYEYTDGLIEILR